MLFGQKLRRRRNYNFIWTREKKNSEEFFSQMKKKKLNEWTGMFLRSIFKTFFPKKLAAVYGCCGTKYGAIGFVTARFGTVR